MECSQDFSLGAVMERVLGCGGRLQDKYNFIELLLWILISAI